MSNRVNVNINVNDNSRAALASLRQSMNRMQRDAQRAGGVINFRVNVDPNTSRADLRRIQRSMNGHRVTINTRLDPPPPGAPLRIRARLRRAFGRGITVPVRASTRGLVGSVRGVFRNTGAVLGGLLSDGLGQGIINGFQKAGPVGVAILAGIILSAMALLGAAIAGALVLAFGGAFVAVAVVAATQFGMITKAWQREKDRLKPLFKDAVQPIVPVIEHAIKLMGDMGAAFAPKFKQALAESAPFLTTFLDFLKKGIASFGKRAFDPMMEAFNTLLAAFGPDFDIFMQGLGDAFANLAKTVRDHSGEISLALRMVFGLITTLIDIVNFLARTWIVTTRVATVGFGGMLMAFSLFVQGFIYGAGKILAAADLGFGWLPGVGDKIGDARKLFQRFGDGVVENLRRMGADALTWGSRMDKANKRRVLEVQISTFQSRLAAARADLKKTADKKAKAKLQADISDLERKLRAARGELNALNGKTATTYVDVWTRNRGYAGNSVTGARAMGGVIGSRAATGGVRGNMTLVGEQGPEIVDLPAGSHVRSNPDTRRLMAGGGGGGPTVLEIRSGGSKLDDLLVEVLQRAIHLRGGNVQVVLGRNH